MKKILVCLAVLFCSGIAFAQNSLTLEIAGVKKSGGKIHISIFNNEKSFDERKTYCSMVANSISETVYVTIALPSGEYVISMYQDINGNGELDTNIMGIPKEPFGFSNYNGKSAPGNFKKHKVIVNESTKKISLHLYKI
jgi:uncharacterized protein (DUF2141 family)